MKVWAGSRAGGELAARDGMEWEGEGAGAGGGGQKRKLKCCESGKSGRDVCLEELRRRVASTTWQRRYATPGRQLPTPHTPQLYAGVAAAITSCLCPSHVEAHALTLPTNCMERWTELLTLKRRLTWKCQKDDPYVTSLTLNMSHKLAVS